MAEEKTDPSYATWPRRMLALLVDWIASTLAVIAFVGPERYYATGETGPGLATLGVFVVESTVLTILAGGSFGKLVTGLRTVSTGRLTPWWPLVLLVRQLMVALVIPPLVFRPDGRGLHDLAAGSRTIRVARR